jgi:hypothetical protein
MRCRCERHGRIFPVAYRIFRPCSLIARSHSRPEGDQKEICPDRDMNDRPVWIFRGVEHLSSW